MRDFLCVFPVAEAIAKKQQEEEERARKEKAEKGNRWKILILFQDKSAYMRDLQPPVSLHSPLWHLITKNVKALNFNK